MDRSVRDLAGPDLTSPKVLLRIRLLLLQKQVLS